MRISVRVAANQNYWFPRFPKVDLDACFPKTDGDERFDEAEFRRQVAKYPFVNIGSNDTGSPLAFAAILIASVNDWLDDNDKDGDPKLKPISERLNRRIERGTTSFVRIDITGVAVEHGGVLVRGVKVRITTDDRNTVERRPFERDFAMVIADFCRCYSERYVSRGDPALVLAPETEAFIRELHGITDDIKRRDEIRDSNGRRFSCPHYFRGFCTSDNDGNPPDFACRHYACGHCVEVEA